MKQIETGNAPGRAFGFVRRTALAVGIAYIISLILILLVGLVASAVKMPDMVMRGTALVLTAFSALVAGYLSARYAGQKGWFFGGIAGLIYLLVLYMVSALAFDGPSFSVSALTMFAIAIMAGMLGGIMGVNKKSGYRRG